jgi:hypothetical protein
VVAGAADADVYNVVFRCLRPEDSNAPSALAGLARAAEASAPSPATSPHAAAAWQELYDNPMVIKAVLKLVMELVYDNGARLAFHLHSPNGVVLFRESCTILSAFSHKAPNLNPRHPKPTRPPKAPPPPAFLVLTPGPGRLTSSPRGMMPMPTSTRPQGCALTCWGL